MNDRVRKIRKSLDLTQQKFADRLSVKRNTVAQWELGINALTDQVIASICREFGVNEDWLRNGGPDEEMFIKLSKDEELARYTQKLLDSTDDIVADTIKNFIVIYEKLDDPGKQVLKNVAEELLNKAKKE
ncbi:MAG: helix-turn-helix domain-containing protein [Roseburia sp.]|nr:helix-turn-helix domain-containing protein [Roseburia sp.]